MDLGNDAGIIPEIADPNDAANATKLDTTNMADIIAGNGNQNMSSMKWAEAQVGLTYPVTGCLREAAIPLPLASGDFCLDGFFCPNSTDDMPPQYCPPTETCQVSRDHGQLCVPQGFLEPQLCEKGFFCPSGGKQMLLCPTRHFCPYGTVVPIKCKAGSWCPSGSTKELQLLPLGVTAIVDGILFSLVLLGLLAVRCARTRPPPDSPTSGTEEVVDHRENKTKDPGWLANPPIPRATHEKLRELSLPAQNQTGTRVKGILRSSIYQAKKEAGRGMRKVSFTADTIASDGSSRYSQPVGPSRAASIRSVFYPEFETRRILHSQRNAGFERRSSVPKISYWSRDTSMISDRPSFHAVPYSDMWSPSDDLESNPDMQVLLRGFSDAIHTHELGLSFQFKDLGCTIKGVGPVLSGVSGDIRQGSMVGIMGGAGAGKSTLLNILMGKKKHTRGTVKICGYDKDLSQYGQLVGYVPQMDVLLPELTVRENILHAARCRLPRSWKDKRIQRFVDSLISCLALTSVQHALVGDARRPVISGGQRKRLSIGIELAAAPMAIFLDEPTTGLDATSAEFVMRLLKTISGLGVTIVAIIHQPREEIFNAFDNLLLLAEGRQLFFGPTNVCEGYFANQGFRFPPRTNPADTIMDIIMGSGSRHSNKSSFETSIISLSNYWHDAGRFFKWPPAVHKSPVNTLKLQKALPPRPFLNPNQQSSALKLTLSRRGAPWYWQLYLVLTRSLTSQLRQRASVILELLVSTFAGLLIGLSAFSSDGNLFHGIYHEPFALFSPAVNNSSSLQLALLVSVAIGICASSPGVRVFGEDKLLYAREMSAGHSRSAYFVGKNLAQVIRLALATLHFTAMMLVLATPRMSFAEAYSVNLAYFYAIYGVASVVSVLIKKEDGGIVTLLVTLVLAVFGGVAPPLKNARDWNLEWAWRVGPGVWLCEAYFDRLVSGTGNIYILDLASKATGMTLGRFHGDVIVIFALGTAYRFVGYGAMRAMDWFKKRRD